MDLGLGSTILVFGKRPPGVNDPQDALVRRELRLVQSGLVGAGAEEVCHLVFGGGYLLLAKPFDLPLYDATTPVAPDQLWKERDRFNKVLDGLRALARQVSDAV